jgi:peroxiredoxin
VSRRAPLAFFFVSCLALSCAQQPVASASAPGFELQSIDGASYRLDEQLGKSVVLIDFWATYCDPCLMALPQLQRLQRKYQSADLIILGINIDGPDSLASVRAEIAKSSITFPTLLDPETRTLGLYNPKATVPFTVLIDRAGRIVEQHEGYTAGYLEHLDTQIQTALSR